MTSGGGPVEEARPFPMINSNDSTTSSPTLSSIDSYDESMGGMGVSDQSNGNVSPRAKPVHPGERVFNWATQQHQQQQQSGDNSSGATTTGSDQPVTLTNINALTPISPSNEDVHSAEQYKHPQPSVLRYPFTPSGYYYTGFQGFTPAVFTMPENEKYRKMLLRKQKRASKNEKHVAHSMRAEDIDGHKDIDIDQILQSMGETVEEDKKGKTKKVKAEKTKVGKKEKRKGSGEQTATATDNVDNEEDETAEDIKVEEEEKKDTNAVRNQFVEEDLMSFKQNFYLVNSDDSRSRDNGPIVEEILASPSQSSFTKVTSKKNRGKKTKEDTSKVPVQAEEPPRSYQVKPREREFLRRKETSPEVFPPVEKQAPVPAPVVTDIESFPTLLKDDFPALPGGLSDTQEQLKDNIKDNEPRIGAWSRVVTKASEDNIVRGHNTDTGANDDHEEVTTKEEPEVIVVDQQDVEEVTVIDYEVPKQQPEEPEVEVVDEVQETIEESDEIVADQNSNCDEDVEEEVEIIAEKIRVITTEEEFEQKETNEHSPVVIFSENNQDWTSSEFTFGFDVNEDLVANSNPALEMPGEEVQQSEAAQQYWHPQSNLQLNDNAILSFGAATAGPGPEGVRPLIVGVPVGVPIPVSSYHQGLSFYPVTAAPGPVLQYPYTFPFPGQPLPSDQEDPELAAKMADQCHEDATISPESGISSSSPLSWQPDASPSLAAAPGCYPTPGPGPLVSQVSKSLSNWKGHGSDHEEEGPGWATQVDMEQDNGQDSGLAASDHSLSSLKSRKTERFNIGEIVHFISDSWSSVSGDSSIPVFSAAKEAKVPVA